MNIETTLEERGSRYGDFSERCKVAQALQNVMRDADGFHRCTPEQKQALTVFADKISRILTGDPNYADNWHDIQGYARLVEERLPVAVTKYIKSSALPEGFLHWDPAGSNSWPVRETVEIALRRDGKAIKGREASDWGLMPGRPGLEIVGYKLNG